MADEQCEYVKKAGDDYLCKSESGCPHGNQGTAGWEEWKLNICNTQGLIRKCQPQTENH